MRDLLKLPSTKTFIPIQIMLSPHSEYLQKSRSFCNVVYVSSFIKVIDTVTILNIHQQEHLNCWEASSYLPATDTQSRDEWLLGVLRFRHWIDFVSLQLQKVFICTFPISAITGLVWDSWGRLHYDYIAWPPRAFKQHSHMADSSLFLLKVHNNYCILWRGIRYED